MIEEEEEEGISTILRMESSGPAVGKGHAQRHENVHKASVVERGCDANMTKWGLAHANMWVDGDD